MLSMILAMTLAANVTPQMIVSTEWLADNINHPDVRLLDVTTLKDFNKAHIPNAVFLNQSALTERTNGIANELPSVAKLESLFRRAGVRDTDRVILTSYDPLLATRAFFTLDYLGWGDRVSILNGGNVQWRNEGRSLVTTIGHVAESDFKARPQQNVLLTKEELKKLRDSGAPFTIIDARNTRYFLGQKRGDEVKRAGHIPGAKCIPWDSNASMKNGAYLLRQADELREMYAPFNITDENQKIVLYCRTGMEATMNYFVLRYLGFRPLLYDGSYVEWSRTEAIASIE